MEAASAILYSANSVKGDRNTRWRNVVIHEIAHQWFGNAVTEYDWDDIWLSEGFATYFTLLFIEHYYGKETFTEGLISSKKRVESFHEKNPDYIIIHDNLKNMKDVTSSQTYQKGSWVLHMLRGVLGTEIFWKGIRSYYSKFKDLNATTEDFRQVMEEASGLNLNPFFQQWLYKPGTLELDGQWFYDKQNKELILEINQIQKGGGLIQMPIEIGIDSPNQTKIVKIQLKDKQGVYKIKIDQKPLKIILDPNLWVLMNSNFELPYQSKK
jgi:aminopeptidase N